MKDTARTCRCSICDKTIKYRLSIATDKIHEKRICLECAFYEIKAVKLAVFIFGLLGLLIFSVDFIHPNFISESHLFKIISLVISGILVLMGLIYYLIFIFLKIFRKRISFKYKKIE